MYKSIHIPLIREHHIVSRKGYTIFLTVKGETTIWKQGSWRSFKTVIELVIHGAYIKDLNVSIRKKSLRCKFKIVGHLILAFSPFLSSYIINDCPKLPFNTEFKKIYLQINTFKIFWMEVLPTEPVTNLKWHCSLCLMAIT